MFKRNFILSTVFLLNTISYIEASEQGRFILGPKYSISGTYGSVESIYYNNAGNPILQNNYLYTFGRINTIGIFGGWIKSIQNPFFFQVGVVTELNYRFYTSRSISKDYYFSTGTEKPDYIFTQSICLPVLLKFAIPVLKIYTGPRIRFLLISSEVSSKNSLIKKTTDRATIIYLDYYFKTLIGFQRWGLDGGIGVETEINMNLANENIKPDGRSNFSFVACLSYDILNFMK